MREILFKAKRIDNGEWVYWNIFGEMCRESGKRTRLAIRKGATTSYYDYIHQIITLIDKNTICRATGLTDKNGNKIWENDIIRHYNTSWEPEKYTIGFVRWNGVKCRLENVVKDKAYTMDHGCKYEVIGNVFDNAELLEE